MGWRSFPKVFGADCVGEEMDEPALSSSLDGGRERDGVAAGMGEGASGWRGCLDRNE